MMRFFQKGKPGVPRKERVKHTFEWRSALLGMILGACVLFLLLDRETPVVASVVESWIYGEGEDLDAATLRRVRDRFEEAITLINVYHDGEVAEEDFVRMIDKGMETFGRFDGTMMSWHDGQRAPGAPPQLGWVLRSLDEERAVLVDYVVPGAPVFNQGIRAGDKIVRVLDDPASVARLDEAWVDDPGSVRVEVLRGAQRLALTVSRDEFSLPVAMDYGVENGVLHLVIRGFSPGAAKQVRDIIDARIGEIEAVMIDLRNNSGGYVDEAEAMIEDFLPEGVVAFQARGRMSGEQSFVTSKPQRWPGLVFSVLQNGRSASCSELLAGALKEAKLAIVVGWSSVGKGSIQRMVPARHGGQYRVTIAKYTVGDNVVVDAVGIVPDVLMPGADPLSSPLYSSDDESEVIGREMALSLVGRE